MDVPLSPSIDGYALIGDCGSAALVSNRGSIDWLCWPRFDSPSVFGALLDPEVGGHFEVAPVSSYEVDRRYLDRTNVLETVFETEEGVLRLRDLMPVAEPEEYRRTFWPDHQILRTVVCLEGEVEIALHYAPRPDYGRSRATLRRRGELGVFCTYGKQVLVLRTEIPSSLSEDARTLRGRETLTEGDRRSCNLTFDSKEPAVLPLLGTSADERIDDSVEYWEAWSEKCTYDGPYREVVVRSALTLKLMTFARSGSVVAAPTTSLPEELGGVRNWDYRYCWLRDATFTLQVLFELGYTEEEEAFFEWLMTAGRTTLPELSVLYDVYGGIPEEERELKAFRGYRDSRPVRIGNGALDQFQLDVYGELIGATCEYVQRGRTLHRRQSRMIGTLASVIESRWTEPDNGIWEIREDRSHHTYSLARCSLACDQLLRLQEEGHVEINAAVFEELGRTIRSCVEERGFDERLNSYTRTLDGEAVDASLLLLALSGYAESDADRMRGTWERIEERLNAGNGMLRRYRIDDGLPGVEGAFGICSFWAVAYLARLGEIEEAVRRFERLLERANDVGLFAEEIDPETNEALGNFPQAFTHVGVINASLQIAKAGDEPSDTAGR